MTHLLRTRVFESVQAFAAVFRNVDLRRLELAWAGSVVGEWASIVALSIFAYEQGGATYVGLVVLSRMLPSAVGAPFMALLADRYRRERVMLLADGTRAVAMAAAAVVVVADASPALVFALAGFVALVSTAFRPAQVAVLPRLARSPDELAAANAVSTTVESVGFFLGPAFAGLLLAISGPGLVFVAQAVAFVWSGVLVSRIRATDPATAIRAARRESVPAALFAGFRAVVLNSRVRLLIGMFAAQTLVHGAFTVLIVVAALDLLDVGDAGVGLLASMDGVGGLIAAFVVVGLVQRARLARAFGLGIVLWGLPIALIGVWANPVIAFVLVAVVGVGNTLVDVAGVTLLQRAIPDDVLARVFGVLESIVRGAVAVGGAVAPLLVAAVGIRGALVVTGLFLPALAAILWRRLAALDAAAPTPTRQLALLRSIPMFAPLPPPTLEALALSLASTRVREGEMLFRQGESGDRFYVIDAGEVEISLDRGESRTLGPGDYFGEIALLRDVSRTASASARTETTLFALGRDDFIAAVTGHPASAEAADAVVAARLSSLRPSVASL